MSYVWFFTEKMNFLLVRLENLTNKTFLFLVLKWCWGVEKKCTKYYEIFKIQNSDFGTLKQINGWDTKDSISKQIFKTQNDIIFIFWNILQVQQCIEFLVDEALRMGAHPDDRDSVTDMTFLMFTCKAGAAGVGDGTMAAKGLKIWVIFMCPRN